MAVDGRPFRYSRQKLLKVMKGIKFRFVTARVLGQNRILIVEVAAPTGD